ncbi:MAG: hypothetical protein RL692_737, partial [Planctomycetota bacterium]
YSATDLKTFEREFDSPTWAAVKSTLGAQTVLGDRHDPVV